MRRRLDGVSDDSASCQDEGVRTEAPAWPAPEREGGK